jgi:hypothetical protein
MDPLIVANFVVVPLTVPTVGVAPAPPPMTGMFAVNAPLEVKTPEAVNPRMPPFVPDVRFVPPWATSTFVPFQMPVVIVPTVAMSVPTNFEAGMDPGRKLIVSGVDVTIPLALKAVTTSFEAAADPAKAPKLPALLICTLPVDPAGVPPPPDAVQVFVAKQA